MQKGDIVRNIYAQENNPYRYQIIIAFWGYKEIMTINYEGNIRKYAKEHMEVVGHSKEYDTYMESLKNLIDFDK